MAAQAEKESMDAAMTTSAEWGQVAQIVIQLLKIKCILLKNVIIFICLKHIINSAKSSIEC